MNYGFNNGQNYQVQPYQPYAYPPNQGEGFSLKEKIQYSLLGIVVIGGAFLIGRNIIKKAEAKSEQRKTLEEGSAPTYAKQIKMAFHNDGWPGTNVEALRQVVREIPDKKDFRKVMTSYQKLYNSSMLGDMQKDLTSSEYDEMLYIVSAKPEVNKTGKAQEITTEQLQSWAKRLKSAFDLKYWFYDSTDDDAIKAVFLEIPTQTAFSQVSAAYKSLYGNELTADLKKALRFWQYDPMMQIIKSKPNN